MALTIEQIQANITNKMDSREIINQIADYLEANPGGGGSSYLVYTALLMQSSTDPPVATELQNTLGGTVVWTRLGAGAYAGTLAGAFPSGKTAYFISNNWDNNSIYILGENSVPDSCYVEVRNLQGGAFINADGFLNNTAVEIRVYP